MWHEKNGSLFRKFEFKDFAQAFGFMQAVALAAEALNHHPKWQNEWNQVEIWLTTHSEGDKVTDKDRQLSAKIDQAYENTKI